MAVSDDLSGPYQARLLCVAETPEMDAGLLPVSHWDHMDPTTRAPEGLMTSRQVLLHYG